MANREDGFLDQVRGVRADNRRTEQAAVGRPNEADPALGFPAGARHSAGGEGKEGGAGTFLGGLNRGANRGHLGVRINPAGHHRAIVLSRMSRGVVGGHDPHPLGQMGVVSFLRHIPDRINGRYIGPTGGIHGDDAIRHADPGTLEAKILDVCGASNGDNHASRLNHGAVIEDAGDSLFGAGDLGNQFSREDAHPASGEAPGDRLGDLRLKSGDETGKAFDDRGGDAEFRVDGGEFAADDPTADKEHTGRKVRGHGGLLGGLDARVLPRKDTGAHGARAGGEDDRSGLDADRATGSLHREGGGPGQAAASREEFHATGPHEALDPLAKNAHGLRDARHEGRAIHGERKTREPKLGGAGALPAEPTGGEHRLGRDAAGIEAGPTERARLDERDAGAALGSAERSRIAARAAPEDGNVK